MKAAVDRVQVTAPYAFVPMEAFTVPTPWAEEPGGVPRLDKPHPDGISGEILVRWTAESPLLVGGAGENASSFFQLDPGDPKSIALPGSTLRGAIRALLEVMTMARMEHVDQNAVYAVRDFSGGEGQANRWQEAIKAFDINSRNLPGNIEAGFLRQAANGLWMLQEADWIPVEVSDVLAHFGKQADRAAFDSASVAEKFKLLGDAALGDLTADESARKLAAFQLPGKVYRPARLVLSGIDPKAQKHKEALFFTDFEKPEIPIDKKDIDRFLFIHSRIARGDPTGAPRGTLDFWQEAIAAKKATSMPVFWIDARKPRPGKTELPGGIILSLARSLKIPYRQSVGDVLLQQRAQAEADPALDLVQALFGHVPREGADAAPVPEKPRTAAWRGRVQFADAPVTASSRWGTVQRSGVMGAPRPSFWPYYLAPRDEDADQSPKDWSSEGVNLAGFKRYPVRESQSPFAKPPARDDREANRRVQTQMTFIEPDANGLAFEGRIRFHNLLPAELGALAYALCFGPPGSNAEQRHAFGRGKPQGYGRVRAEIIAQRLERNDGATPDAALLGEAVAAFQRHIERFYGERSGQATAFAHIPAVADTLAIQTPAIGESVKSRLVYPSAQSRHEGVTTVAGYSAIKTAAKAGRPNARLPRYPRKP